MTKAKDREGCFVEPQQRLDWFLHDLGRLTVTQVIRKHILTGEPFALEPDLYYDLRSVVANRFGLHEAGVVVVGSSRTGFTLKANNQGHRYRFWRPSSDLDVAVVSSQLFDLFWQRTHELSRESFEWAGSPKEGRRITKEMFQGRVKPHDLPRETGSMEWKEFFDKLTRDDVFGRRVSAHLYRDWYWLEAYQSVLVADCQRELQDG